MQRVAVVLITFFTTLALAESPATPMGPAEAVGVVVLGSRTLAGEMLIPHPEAPKWTKRNPFDEKVTEALAIEDAEVRRYLKHTTDIGVGVMAAAPILSGGIVALNPDTRQEGFQMMGMAVESEALALGVILATKRIFARERPYYRFCNTATGQQDYDCDAKDRFESFASGHTALSFAAASALCSNHLYGKVIDGKGSDASLCAAALSGATLVNLGRIAVRKHYATDVLAGMGIGLAAGLVPTAIHWNLNKAETSEDLTHPKTDSPPQFTIPLVQVGGAF